MATTFELISKSILTGTQSYIEFTSIPSTFTDLVFKISTRNSDTGDWFNLSFNGSTSDFTGKQIFATGGAAYSYTRSNNQELFVNNSNSTTANTFSNSEVYIPNYTSSNYKSYSVDSVTENNSSTAYSVLFAGLWSNTAAINAVRFTPNANSLGIYSSIYLYGIKNS